MNGIGGKVEEDELPISTMNRESLEEVNYFGEWIHYGRMGGSDWSSELFYSIKKDSSEVPCTMEEEEVMLVSVDYVITGKLKTISNLPWLITSALNHINIGVEGSFFIDVKYLK